MLLKVIIFVVSCSLLIESNNAGCPTIVSRAEWGARAPAGSMGTLPNPVTYAVIHHSEGSACTTKASCITQVKGFQNYHIDSNGWSDIGYNFVVGEDGNVYEGRGWKTRGAHSPAFNSDSIGICIIGTFTSRLPNAAAINAVQNLIKCGVEKGYIKSAYTLKGHRDGTATDCPGNTLYAEIKKWARWSSGTGTFSG